MKNNGQPQRGTASIVGEKYSNGGAKHSGGGYIAYRLPGAWYGDDLVVIPFGDGPVVLREGEFKNFKTIKKGEMR